MDISDINRIAHRKKVTADAEKLREKVSQETEQVIKLKVAQDTAYWDLREKLQQTQAQRDRLQQNLVELQMQYEAISAQYQGELRRHPETRNKVKITHEIFTTLEEYIKQLTATVDRIKEDKVVAVNMFATATQEVKQIIQDIDDAHNRASLNILILSNSLERSEEREANANNALKEAKARADALERQVRDADERAKDAKADLRAAHADRNRLAVALQQESQSVTDLRNRIEKEKIEYETTNSKVQNMIETLEKGRDEALLGIHSERTLREAAEMRIAHFEETLNNLELDRNVSIKRVEASEKKLLELEMILESKESEINNLTLQIGHLETEKKEIQAETDKTLVQCENKVKELMMHNQETASKVVEARKALNEMRESGAKEVQDLKSAIEQKDLELESKMSHVNQLLTDLKLMAENSNRIEVALHDANNATRASGDRERALQLRVDALELALQEKTTALEEISTASRQLASDKERLQEKVVGLQNTIDNINKEIKDGARHEVPDREEVPATSSSSTNVVKDTRIHDLLFSDNNEDNNPRAFDPKEIEHRFKALQRGESYDEPIRSRGQMVLERVHEVPQSSSNKRVFFKTKRQSGKKH